MAYQPRYLGKTNKSGYSLDFSDPQVLERIARNLDISPKAPQANILERVLGVLRGIGSLPDAYKDSQTNRSNILAEYLKNIGGGFSTTLLGTKPEEDFSTSSDILKDWGIFAGDDLGSKIGRNVLGFVGDVALDPSTYVSFGAAGLGKKLGQEAVEAGAKSLTPTALKILGKEVTTNPIAVGSAKALFNPLGEIVKGGAKLAMKTETGENIAKGLAKVFDEGAYAKILNKTIPGAKKAQEKLTEFERLRTMTDALTLDAQNALGKQLGVLPKEVQDMFAQTIEKGAGEVDDLISSGKLTPYVGDLMKRVIQENTALQNSLEQAGILASKLNNTKGEKLFNEFNDVLTKRTSLVANSVTGNKATKTGATGVLGDINPFVNYLLGNESKPGFAADISALGFKINPDDKAVLAKYIVDNFKDKFESRGIEGFIASSLEDMAKKAPKAIDVPYLPRDVLSFNEGYIRNTFGDFADFILNEPLAKKELNNPQIAGITKDTLGKLLNQKTGFLTSRGITDPIKFLEDAANERTFKYLTDGEAAGVRYSKDIQRLFLTGQVRGNRALIENKMVDELKDFTTDGGGKIVYTANEANKLFKGIPPTWKEISLTTDINNRIGTANEIGELSPILKKLKNLIGTREGWAKNLTKEINKLKKTGIGIENAGVSKIRNLLEINAQNTAIRGQIAYYLPDLVDGLGPDATQLKGLIKDILRIQSDPALAAIKKKLAVREPKLVAIMDTINNLEGEAQTVFSKRGDLLDKLKVLNGETKLVGPREIIDLIKNHTTNYVGDESVSNFLKLYDKGMSVFKASVTSRGPGFIGYNLRNAVGDMVNMVAGGFQNKGIDGGDAFSQAKRFMDYRRAVQELGVEGANKKFGEAAKLLGYQYKKILGSGVLSSSQVTEALGGRTAEIVGSSKFKKGTDKALEVLDLATLKGPARYREDFFRIANLIDNVARTGNWEEGARLARLSSLDYNALTSFEKGTMKRIIPFYSFMRQNLKFHLQNFEKNPGVYSGYQHILDNIKKTMESENATSEDYAVLPDWMKRGFSVLTGKSGDLASVLTQTGDPIEVLNDLNPMNIISSGMSPLLRAPIEYLGGKNLFTGESFDSPSSRSGVRYKDMPQAIKVFLKYREVERVGSDGKKYTDYTVDPVRAKILGDLPIVSPLITTGKRLGETVADPTLQKLITLLSGTRFYDVDLKKEKVKRTNERLEKVKRALVNEGYGKESPPRFYFPQEEKEVLQSLLK